jgi:hypothetical protein
VSEQWVVLTHKEIAEAVFTAGGGVEPMIREGERVRVVPRQASPPTQKYASQKGYVTMTTPSVYGPLVFVQLDNNPDGIDTAFEEEDLEEVSPLEG